MTARRYRSLLGILVGVALMPYAARAAGGGPDGARARFEAKYAEWRAQLQAEPFSSNPGSKAQGEMAKLGIHVLPFVVAKIEENAPMDFLLASVVAQISKVRFANEEWPPGTLGDSHTAARMYVHWWREGRKQTPQRFAKLYAGWREDKKQGRAREAEDKHQRMVDLGIAALPHMVEKVAAGDAALIPAISRLTNAAVPKSATPGECTAWWAKNKQKWTLPPVAPQRDG